jgi:bifunctional UDP-N-acetylglucosamine pyrophosphorylase/glucosamine-1-phosphate N-acetyltransferase
LWQNLEMSEPATEQKPLNILILAAGMGTRMRSGLAKVLHKLDGRPLIGHVCRAAASLAPEKILVVVGHQADDVRLAVLSELDDDRADFVHQQRQLGTGDAVNSARDILTGRDSVLLVLSGDVPMIRPETLGGLIQHHRQHRGRGAACTILAVKMADPTGYGRVVRDEDGMFARIVEQKDATDEEREIREINSGIYCFDTGKLFDALANVQNDNAQGEYYLTDVPALMREAGEIVAVYQHGEAREIEGVNDRAQLAELEGLLNRQTVSRLMLDYGVTFIDPKSVHISSSATIGRDTLIYPNVTIEGETTIGDGCTIRSGTRIANSQIASGVDIRDNCLIVDSEVGSGCSVGPMAHLRGSAVMLPGSKVGNFVEMKKTSLGEGSKASHLTYLGDAIVGENTNIGAGVITCNYDGVRKNETKIGRDVKIGSDTMLVAPVSVGDGAVTAAGSVVIEDVPASTLVAGVPARVKKRLNNEEGR